MFSGEPDQRDRRPLGAPHRAARPSPRTATGRRTTPSAATSMEVLKAMGAFSIAHPRPARSSAPPARRSPTSSISASAAPTSARPWRRWRSRPITTARARISSPMSTARISPTRWQDADPATTLFIVASKTFTTIETMTNAATARRWIAAPLGEDAVGDAFRRRLDRARQGRRVRHRQGAHLRLLGLGRRALFDLVGDRPAADDRDRRRRLPRVPRRRARDRPAFPRPRRWTENLPVLLGLVG